jgi:hypothetical protein
LATVDNPGDLGRVATPLATDPSVDPDDHNHRVVLQFLAAYYDINCQHQQLTAARALADPVQRLAREHECLQAIEKTLIRRDALEDQYAPFGIIAEPLAKDGYTIDIRFTFGNVNAAGRLRAAPLSSSTTIPIRLPPGVKLENLTLPDKIPPPNF